MKRPLFVVGFAFFGAMAIATVVKFHIAVGLAIASGFLALGVLAVRALRTHTAMVAALLTATAAFSLFAYREAATVRPLLAMDGQDVSLTVWLAEEADTTDASVAYIAEVTDGALPAGTRVLLWVRQDEHMPECYNTVSGTFHVSATDTWRAEDVYLRAWCASNDEPLTVALSDRRPWNAPFIALRERAFAAIDRVADGDVAALLKSICFGDKSDLSPEIKGQFRAAGLAHLLVVSGFHLTMLMLATRGLLRLLRVSRRPQALAAIAVVAGFTILTGMSRSTLRAAVMCGVLLLGDIVEREADAANSLGAAVLLILAVQPQAVYDVGLLLSVGSMLGLIFLPPLWRKAPPASAMTLRQRIQSKVLDGVILTIAAVLPTLPIVAWCFGEVPLWSVLSNPLADFAAGATVVCGCVGALLPSLIGRPLLFLGGLGARYLLWLTGWISSLPFAAWTVDQPYLLVWVCALPVLLVAGRLLLGRRGTRLACIVAAVLLCVSTLLFRFGMYGVTTIRTASLEGTTAVLLERDGERALLLTDAERHDRQLRTFLHRQGIDRLAFVVYTNSDADDEQITALREQVTVERVLCCADGAALDLWEGCRLTCFTDWTRVTIGETRVMLCPPAGDAALLPEDWRLCNGVIFAGLPPLHATVLTAQQGVLRCDEQEVAAVSKAVPWGQYPIAVTAVDGDAVWRTRGVGDVQL